MDGSSPGAKGNNVRILILGGGGFIGQKLAMALAKSGTLRGETITHLGLADVTKATKVDAPFSISTHVIDIASRDAVDDLLEKGWDAIFHLAAVVSGQAEADFVSGLRANFFGTLNLFESARAGATQPLIVYSSSVAAYGGEVPQPIEDWTNTNPQTSYGSQKVIGELLLNDYSRKGFFDGRGVRLPTVVVRPGKPNAAASSFYSSIIREPLQGEPAMCPVDPESTKGWLTSPRAVVENLIRTAELDAEALGQNRCFNLPGITVTVAQMIASLDRKGGKEATDLIDFDRDPVIEKIVAGWAVDFNPAKALAMGMQADADFDSIVQQFMDDELA